MNEGLGRCLKAPDLSTVQTGHRRDGFPARIRNGAWALAPEHYRRRGPYSPTTKLLPGPIIPEHVPSALKMARGQEDADWTWLSALLP